MRLVVGDFNGDSRSDFALSSANETGAPTQDYFGINQHNWIDVFVGNGDGTFRKASSTQVGPDSSLLVTAHLTGSGKPDLMASDAYGTDVLTGHGDGTFAPLVAYESPTPGFFLPATTGLAAADFNGDGKIDLAEMVRRPTAIGASFSVVVLAGHGDGTLQSVASSTSTPPTSSPSQPLMDFNDDGIPDLVVKRYTDVNGHAGNVLGIALGQPDGTYAPAILTPYGTGDFPQIVTADFNGDGKADVAVEESGSVSVFLGNGDGTLQRR